MLAALALLVATQDASFEALKPQFYGAIWDDLQLNAMIGNYNIEGWYWSNAVADDVQPPVAHIEQLKCRAEGKDWHCSFTLRREGGVRVYLRKRVPDRLDCSARFVLRPADQYEGEHWAVARDKRRRGDGHSRTSMKCRPLPSLPAS